MKRRVAERLIWGGVLFFGFVAGLSVLMPDKGWIMRNHGLVLDKNSKGI